MHLPVPATCVRKRSPCRSGPPGPKALPAGAGNCGAAWAGDSNTAAPVLLDAAIIFAPDGALVPRALAGTCKGATVVCAGIHMRDIPGFPYALLWGERILRSVANLTRADGEAFFRIAEQIDIKTAPVIFPLQEANDALAALRGGRFDGAAVLVPNLNG